MNTDRRYVAWWRKTCKVRFTFYTSTGICFVTLCDHCKFGIIIVQRLQASRKLILYDHSKKPLRMVPFFHRRFLWLRCFSFVLFEVNMTNIKIPKPKKVKMRSVVMMWKLPKRSNTWPNNIGINMEPRLLPKKNKPVMRPVILKRDSPSTSRVGKTEDKARPNPADPTHSARLLDGKMIIKIKKMIARKKFPNSRWAALIFLVNGTASKRPRV